jgi:hypothetical protein
MPFGGPIVSERPAKPLTDFLNFDREDPELMAIFIDSGGSPPNLRPRLRTTTHALYVCVHNMWRSFDIIVHLMFHPRQQRRNCLAMWLPPLASLVKT